MGTNRGVSAGKLRRAMQELVYTSGMFWEDWKLWQWVWEQDNRTFTSEWSVLHAFTVREDPPDDNRADARFRVFLFVLEYINEFGAGLADRHLLTMEGDGGLVPHDDLIDALGRVPWIEEEWGDYRIDESELHRVVAALAAQRDLDWMNHLRGGDGEA